MLKKYAKYPIIVLIQGMGLFIFMGLIAPLLIQHGTRLNEWHAFVSRFYGLFFIWHGLFYIVLYCSWPSLVRFIINHQEEPSSAKQRINALKARYYLIGVCLLFELLHALR